MVTQKVASQCGRIRLHANNGWHACVSAVFFFAEGF